MDWMRSSPEAIFGRYFCFCASEPLRTMAFITYIWPWQAPELPPLRLISSMITEASAIDRPEPPYSCGISAAIQPAWSAHRQRLPGSRAARRPCGNTRRELGAQGAHGVADVLVGVGGWCGSSW
jgi:hypothetical protein